MIGLDGVDEVDGQGLAQALDANHRATLGRQAYQLVLAAAWADVHNEDSVPTDAAGKVLPGRELVISLGHDGTPKVAEFATAELAVLQGTSRTGAGNLVGDALDLRHRHPRLWDRLLETARLAEPPDPTTDPDGAAAAARIEPVRAWQARHIARECGAAGLTLQQARAVDAATTGFLGNQPWNRFLGGTLATAITAADPKAAADRAETAAKARSVTFGRPTSMGSSP